MTEDCVKFWTVYEAAHALQDVTPLITHGQDIVIQLSPENGDVDGNQGITNTSRIVESQGMGSSQNRSFISCHLDPSTPSCHLIREPVENANNVSILTGRSDDSQRNVYQFDPPEPHNLEISAVAISAESIYWADTSPAERRQFDEQQAYDPKVLEKFISGEIAELKEGGLVDDQGRPIFSQEDYEKCQLAVNKVEDLYKEHMRHKVGNSNSIFNEFEHLEACGINYDPFRLNSGEPCKSKTLVTLYLHLKELRNRETITTYIINEKRKKEALAALKATPVNHSVNPVSSNQIPNRSLLRRTLTMLRIRQGTKNYAPLAETSKQNERRHWHFKMSFLSGLSQLKNRFLALLGKTQYRRFGNADDIESNNEKTEEIGHPSREEHLAPGCSAEARLAGSWLYFWPSMFSKKVKR